MMATFGHRFTRKAEWHPTTVCPTCHAGFPNGPDHCRYCGRPTIERGGYYVVPLATRRDDP